MRIALLVALVVTLHTCAVSAATPPDVGSTSPNKSPIYNVPPPNDVWQQQQRDKFTHGMQYWCAEGRRYGCFMLDNPGFTDASRRTPRIPCAMQADGHTACWFR